MYVNVENVNFAYDKKPILHDINFGMNKGEITGLIGPNGAGKSTMLKLMIKKMKPNNGKIIIGDNDILYQDASASASPKYVKFYTFS